MPLPFLRQVVGGIQRGDRREFVGRERNILGSAVRIRSVRAIENQLALDDLFTRGQFDGVVVVRAARDQRGERRETNKRK